MLLTIISLTLIATLMFFVGNKLKPEWFHEINTKITWRQITIASSIFGLLFAFIAALLGKTIEAQISLLVFTWLFPIVCLTDFKAYKIPRGVSKMVYWFGFCLAGSVAVYYQNLTTLLFVGLMLIIPFTLMFVNGIGFGDIRLLIGTASLFSWWIGVSAYNYALIGASLLQLLLFIATVKTSHGKYTEPVEGKKRKRMLPFGPALMLGFIISALFFSPSGVPCESLLCINYL